MSWSEITVLKLYGTDATQTYQSLSSFFNRRRNRKDVVAMSSDNWPSPMCEEINDVISPMLSTWDSPDKLYSSRYMDNDSVAGSQMQNVFRIIRKLHKLCVTGVLATENRHLFFMKPDENSVKIFNTIKTNTIFRQKAERMLWFNLREVCDAWNICNHEALVVAIDKVLGPSLTEMEIFKRDRQYARLLP
jgi:hypothetical protein